LYHAQNNHTVVVLKKKKKLSKNIQQQILSSLGFYWSDRTVGITYEQATCDIHLTSGSNMGWHPCVEMQKTIYEWVTFLLQLFIINFC